MKVGLTALLICSPVVVLAAVLWWKVTLALVLMTLALKVAGDASLQRPAGR